MQPVGMLLQNSSVVAKVWNTGCLSNVFSDPQAVSSPAQVTCMEKVPTTVLENATIALDAAFNNVGDGQFDYGSLLPDSQA